MTSIFGSVIANTSSRTPAYGTYGTYRTANFAIQSTRFTTQSMKVGRSSLKFLCVVQSRAMGLENSLSESRRVLMTPGVGISDFEEWSLSVPEARVCSAGHHWMFSHRASLRFGPVPAEIGVASVLSLLSSSQLATQFLTIPKLHRNVSPSWNPLERMPTCLLILLDFNSPQCSELLTEL
jgi:hypothetical protein